MRWLFKPPRGIPPTSDSGPASCLDVIRLKAPPCGCGTGEACRTCGAVAAILEGLDGENADRECHISLVENETLDLRIYESPFRWQGSEYVLVIATDISGQKRRQILERIFFHDILNTAGGIQGLAGIISEDLEQAAELSPMLRSSAEKLVHEIKSRFQLLAAENHSLEVTPSRLSTRAELDSVASLYRHHEAAEGRSIVMDQDTVDASMTCDGAILQRVLGNLLKNALEASHPGGIVTLGAKTEGGNASSGATMPDASLRRDSCRSSGATSPPRARDGVLAPTA